MSCCQYLITALTYYTWLLSFCRFDGRAVYSYFILNMIEATIRGELVPFFDQVSLLLIQTGIPNIEMWLLPWLFVWHVCPLPNMYSQCTLIVQINIIKPMRTEYLTGRPNSIGCQKLLPLCVGLNQLICRPAGQTLVMVLSLGQVKLTGNSKVSSSWFVLELNFYF